MRITGTEDLRVQKTVEAIRSTFEQMLLEREFDKITVKELCERARINKKTFYRYYPALEDLLAELQAELSQDYLERTRNLSLPEDIPAITEAFFRYSEEKGPLYEAITSQARFDSIRQPMMDRVMDATPGANKQGDPEHAYLITFITSTTMGIYREWIASGKDLPVESVIELTTTLLCEGARGLRPAGKRAR